MTEPLSLSSIPHRPPFLFVDTILEVRDKSIRTRKFIDPATDFFRGHYPQFPVMPGVLVCECCFQAGALLISHRLRSGTQNGVPVVTRIQDARFKRMVRPGQTLEVEVTLDDELDGAYFMVGRATVEGQLAARVGFVCMQANPAETFA